MNGSFWCFQGAGRGNELYEVMDFIDFEPTFDDNVYDDENEADFCVKKTASVLLMCLTMFAITIDSKTSHVPLKMPWRMPY